MQGRILAFFLPIVLVFTGLLSWFLAAEIVRSESAAATTALQVRADQLAGGVDFMDGDLEVSLESLALDDGEVVAVMSGDRGSVVASSGNLPVDAARLEGLAPPVGEPPAVWPWETDPLVVFSDAGEQPIALVAASGTLRSEIRSRLALVVMAVATGLLAIAALAYPLARWALRPVQALDDTAHALGAGDLTARASVGRGAPELQRLADAFNEMAEEMSMSMERERAFVADATHHLGNLLTPLRLRIEVLKQGDMERPAEQALAEVDRIEAVVERLLALARAEDRRSVHIAVDVVAAVDECLHTWEPLALARGVSLGWAARHHGDSTAIESDRYAPSVPVFAKGVPGAIEEVLDLFVDNSLKYGAGAPVHLDVIRGLTTVRVIVRDHGPGLSSEELLLARGRFWRSAQNQSQPGSGLGLAVAEALAEACGGRVELRSRQGRGLEASLVLAWDPGDRDGEVEGDDVVDLDARPLSAPARVV